MRMKLLFGLIVLQLSQLYGQTILVSNLNDSGPNSFRQAIIDANLTEELDTIEFIPAGTLTLTSADSPNINWLPNIINPILIEGNNVTITSELTGRFFQIGAQSTIRNLTFEGGSSTASPGSSAGAIFISGTADSVLFQNCMFTENEASSKGGALRIVNSVSIFENCQFVDNVASSGNIINVSFGTAIFENVVLNQTDMSMTQQILLENDAQFEMSSPFEYNAGIPFEITTQ